MTDVEMVELFERGIAPEGAFHHRDHVRVAFAYLAEFPFVEALEKFSDALRRFAAAQGQPGLYHETITWAYLFLIRERMAGRKQDWEEFEVENQDLLKWKDGIVQRMYGKDVLASQVARKMFVLPGVEKFPSF